MPTPLARDCDALIEAIREKTLPVLEKAPALVVIDTLNGSIAGSENDDRDMAGFLEATSRIRDSFGCAVTVVHHCGHEATRPRGHSSLLGAADAQIVKALGERGDWQGKFSVDARRTRADDDRTGFVTDWRR